LSVLVVGISDCKTSSDQDAVLTTYALGSCIAVAVYDPVTRIGGLLHYMLPESSIEPAKAAQNPCMFADTGIPDLLKRVRAGGASQRRMAVRIAGGAQMITGHDLFQIGRRNYLAARKLLWKEGLMIAGESIGGEVSRTVRMEVATGQTWVREGAVESQLDKTRRSVEKIETGVR
jgi:chemotaxis protein CheD